MTAKTDLNPLAKLALDLGPLVLFFFANARPALFMPLVRPFFPELAADGERAGIFVATAVFMVAVVAAFWTTARTAKKISAAAAPTSARMKMVRTPCVIRCGCVPSNAPMNAAVAAKMPNRALAMKNSISGPISSASFNPGLSFFGSAMRPL